jgi:membrane protein involved in colicin uptake
MENQIIQLTGVAGITIEVVQDAKTARDNLLTESAKFTTIADSFTYELATEQAKAIKLVLKQVEASRREVKRPLDEQCAKIQELARTYTEPLETEQQRLGKLILAYEDSLARKRAEAERLAREEIERIRAREEAERRAAEQAAREAQAAAQAAAPFDTQTATTAKIEAINATHAAAFATDVANAEIAAVKQNLANEPTAKAKGLRRTTITRFKITDEDALHASHPEVFTPDDAKIRALLKITKTIPGLEIWEETKI